MSLKLGIDSISFFTPNQYLDLATLAKQQDLDPEHYYKTIGQHKMAVAAIDEDIVSLAANAADRIINDENRDKITNILFATESGVDQSKAAGIYIQSLLNLPSNCRVSEIKQACYGSTAALQYGLGLIARNPEQKILVLAADIARYGLNTPGEPSQGAGAMAMVLSANPKFLEIEPESGFYTQDIMDFWRPNYRDEALVEGKYSSKMYLQCLKASWENLYQQNQRPIIEYDYFCYHTPVCRLAETGHKQLHKLNKNNIDQEILNQQVQYGLTYNREIGNCYTAAVYMSLISLADNCPNDLTNKRVGIYAYGSGCVAEYLSGKLVENYQEHCPMEAHQLMLNNRKELSYQEYADYYAKRLPTDGSDVALPKEQSGKLRLSGISQHKRLYEQA